MYTGLLDQNWIRKFFGSIGYPIGPPSNLYKDNQATIKRVLEDIITPKARTIDALINALHELHLRKTFDMVDTRSNTQLADHKSNPHGGKSRRDLIDRDIGDHFDPPPESNHYKLLQLDQFHGPTHINNNHEKKNEVNRIMHSTKPAKISYARKTTTKSRVNQM